MKIAFIILHYLALKDTIECAESIISNINSSNHQIDVVIVDNGSPDSSYDAIKDKFSQTQSVHVMRNESNLGFAKGNNVGYKYAKYELKADFIILLNNDTIVSQNDFVDVLVNKYFEKKYYVLGPDIVAADGYHQNPGNKQSWNLKELSIYRLKKRILLFLSYLHLDNLVTSTFGKTKNVYRDETLIGDIENIILHGACLIFSPLYVNRFNGLYDETFLYMEEDILKLYADFYGFLMMYSSDIRIFHKEDAATNMVPLNSKEKTRLKYKRLIESSKKYSKLKRTMLIKKKIVGSIEYVAGKIKSGGAKYIIDFDMPITYLIGIAFQRGIMLIRGKIRKIGIKQIGKMVFIGKSVTLKCKTKMNIGNNVTIQDHVLLDALSKNGIHLEDGASIGRYSVVRCSGNYHELGYGFHLGKNSSLADECFIGATGGVYIGDNVICGQRIKFHASNHYFNRTDINIKEQGIDAKGINIGNNCWIGAGVVFCDGVSIGNGCVVGANTVVTKCFPDNSIIVGVPAKIIGKRL